MKHVALALVALAALAACGEDADYVDPSTKREQQIRSCIADGGTPQYAVNSSGIVRDYFGCVQP